METPVRMETPASAMESLFERVEAFGKTTIELSKLKAVEVTSNVVASLISRIAVLLVAALFIGVLSIGLALMIGDMMGKTYYGFFIIAAFYLLLGIVLHTSLHKWIKNPIGNSIISQLFQ